MTIWKFPLKEEEQQVVEIPEINRPLTVQMQAHTPCMWAVVDPDSPRIRIRLRTFGTGNPDVMAGHEYVGSYQTDIGVASLVFHVFVEGRA